MSLIKGIGEYVNMVKNGVKNGDKIIEGIRTAALVKEQTKRNDLGETGDVIISDEAIAEIMKRKDLCASCEFNSRNAKAQRNYSSSLPFEHCTLCKCRIGYEDGKEYCLSCNCGILAWNERNPTLPPMELKWTAFEENKK